MDALLPNTAGLVLPALRVITARCRPGALAGLLLLLCGCVSGESTPGAPRLLATTLLSAAGLPPSRPDFHAEPARVSETLKFTAITAGADHSCALEAGGATWCWGSNQYQQLGGMAPAGTCGNANLPCSAVPVRLDAAPAFTALAASIWGTCGLDAAGAAHCWGFGIGGRQGEPLPASSGVAVEVPGNHAFAALAASPAGNQSCGLTATGHAWCWSATGNTTAGSSQVFSGPDIVAADLVFSAISHGTQHGCGIDELRNAYCWGSNQFGQLGTGSSALAGGMRESPAPVAVQGGLVFSDIVAGPGHSCGLRSDGTAWCWGLSFTGEAGSRIPDRRLIPHGAVPVPVSAQDQTWVALAAGTAQTCALSADDAVYCFTAIPVRSVANRRPVRVDSDERFVQLAVGGNHACALNVDGFAYCWGLSHLGQAGRLPGSR